MVFTLADVLEAKIRIVPRYFEHFEWRQSARDYQCGPESRATGSTGWQTVVETNRQPPSPLLHPPFLLFSPFWSHQWCSHRGAWHQRQRCTHCTEVEPASYFALPANCTALSKYASCIVQNYTAAAQCNSSAGSVHKSTAWLHPNLIALAKWTLQRHWLGSKLWGTQCNIRRGSRLHCSATLPSSK